MGFILEHPIACQLSRDICMSADRSEQMRENCYKDALNWHSLPCVYGGDYKTQQTNSKFVRSRTTANGSLPYLGHCTNLSDLQLKLTKNKETKLRYVELVSLLNSER